MPTVIYGIFAGRRENLAVHMRYVHELLNRGLVQEAHLWDFTENEEDKQWLHERYGENTQSNVKIMVPSEPGRDGWHCFYQEYTPEWYPNHVIVKADDDIVYVQVDGFETFVRRTVDDEKTFLNFPSIVNNEMLMWTQGRKLWGDDIFDRLDHDSAGRLHRNGTFAEEVHEYFLKNRERFEDPRMAQRSARVRLHEGNRVSINMIAVHSRKLAVFSTVKPGDDELMLTVSMSLDGHTGAMDRTMVVSHLAFAPHRRTGMNTAHLLSLYAQLADALGMPPVPSP